MSASRTRGAWHRARDIFTILSIPIFTAIGAGPAVAAVTAPITGEIQKITLNNPADHWSGGTIVVGGQNVIIPRNLLMDLPANRLTLQQIFAQAPAGCVAAGQSGLAKGDSCNATGAGAIATIAANRTDAGNIIAGDVFIQKGIEAVTGQITYIDYNDGYFRVNGNPADPTTGVMVRLNDPTARHTVQQGLGCVGGPNCSADPRFTLDPDNYTNVFTTGYPLCIPSRLPRPFPGLASSPVLPAGTAQALADGSGDVLCPTTNRTINNGQPVADSRRFAPIMIGDSITAEGNFENINGVPFFSAHTTMVAKALTTQNTSTQPDYIFFDEVFIDAPGFQNQRVRSLFIGFSTLAPADVLIWSIHYDPATNAKHEFPLGTSAGCDIAAGPSTCSGQGIVPGGGDIFRIRHDVDFGVGAKARLNPCAHLRAEPRFATASPICPTNGSAEALNIGEMVGILSPIPHEIQARTGHKLANPSLITLDVNGNQATNGQYLFPFGIGLGGIDIPNFMEIDINQTQTPFSFSGIPWNLDRRLSPGGCDGACESTPQPLDPFPFEGLAMDPRLQAPPQPPLSLGLPTGPYSDPNYTSGTLSNVSNRILSFVGAGGIFNGDATVLAWPPADPPLQTIVPTPNIDLVCTANTPANMAPVAVADTASVTAGQTVIIPVLANDSDSNGDPLNVTGLANVVGGTATVNLNNSVSFAANASFAGTGGFTYTISDGQGGSATADVTVTVNALPAANVAPVANPDTATVAAAGTVVVSVLANDTDANGDALTVTAVGNLVGGTATTNGTTVSFTANAGFSGSGGFSYTISDGHGGTATSTVTVTVGAADTVAVTTALFRTGKLEWRVSGTGTATGATITIHLGPLTGPVVGVAQVDAVGNFAFRQQGSAIQPTPGSTISVESNRGARSVGIPVTIRN